MSRKTLDIEGITNELKGASLFFTKQATPPPSPEPQAVDGSKPESPPNEQTQDAVVPETSKRDIDISLPVVKSKPINKRVMNKSLQASNNASMHASNQPFNQETIIEIIRKAVKDVGKDSATYRFTPEEKKALLELSFSYKMQGYKTSENELTRIAINFLLEDHKQSGQNSILRRVLDALNK
jgi:hypothetical protein